MMNIRELVRNNWFNYFFFESDDDIGGWEYHCEMYDFESLDWSFIFSDSEGNMMKVSRVGDDYALTSMETVTIDKIFMVSPCEIPDKVMDAFNSVAEDGVAHITTMITKDAEMGFNFSMCDVNNEVVQEYGFMEDDFLAIGMIDNPSLFKLSTGGSNYLLFSTSHGNTVSINDDSEFFVIDGVRDINKTIYREIGPTMVI